MPVRSALAPAAVDGATTTAPSRRARKKDATRRALADTAVRLFAAQGFDETTVEQIADAVDVSPRTFHRYFERKEDAVFADRDDRLARFRLALDARPDDEPPLAAVRSALVEVNRELGDVGEVELLRARLIRDTPALRAANLHNYDDWSRAIAHFVARRTGARPDDPWPSLAGRCVISAVIDARRRWAADGGDLARRVRHSLDLLARFGAEMPGGRP